MRYTCPELQSLERSADVRSPTDAARRFAHRLAMKMFGRAGLCKRIKRVARVGNTTQFEALIGTRLGPEQQIIIPVTSIFED